MKMRVRNKASRTSKVTPLEKANLEVAYKAAIEGIVLMENNGVLPMEPKRIALYGAGAGMTIKGGTGSGEVNERHAVSILEGMEKAGFQISTKKWIRDYDAIFEMEEEAYAQEFRKKILTLSPDEIMSVMSNPFQYPYGRQITEKDIAESNTDTCFYVIARQAGEGGDRRLKKYEYSISPREKENLVLCASKYKNFIVVINVGSTFDMKFLDEIEGIDAAVYFCQQGTMGGTAFADLVTGKEVPSGKFVDSWAFHYEDYPFAKEYSYLNGNLAEEYYREGIYVGYRYFDSYNVTPKYEFGYGLSYTSFVIRTENISLNGDTVSVSVNVKNMGDDYAGKEVVQIYVSCPQGELAKEYQKLTAFAKTKVLKPGEEQNLEIKFKVSELASFRARDSSMVLEDGNYIVRVGNSSRNTKTEAVLHLKEEVIVEKLRHICEKQSSFVEISAAKLEEEVVEDNVKIIEIDEKYYNTRVCQYIVPKVYSSSDVDEFMGKLSLKEMIQLTVGTGLATGTYFHAPGAAGATTGKLLKKGIPNVCLADGPAGLRLQRRSTVAWDGKVKAVDPFLSLMKYFPDVLKKAVLGNPEKDPVIYQFTTAFPVGLAIAQSWNTELAEEVGRAVGEEMKAYGVTYWLAPALNIHRNPLCGRNFEYYSEDPYVSGKIAAAITKGVQKNRGCYVTLKHFCCNNQEDNRNKTNANVSERALREIYLRGFEIAVRDANPGAIMSSYNKVNGIYVNNSYDLLTKVLRNEWGFSGLVMTDWFATGKGLGNHALALAAGNDLIMPGGMMAEKEIAKAVENGLIQPQDVRRCAANILKGILSSRIYHAYKKNEKKR